MAEVKDKLIVQLILRISWIEYIDCIAQTGIKVKWTDIVAHHTWGAYFGKD